MTNPVFIEGQMITPVYTNGYALTMGKEYQVVMYGEHGAAKPHGSDEWVVLRVKIQDYRHAWLVHLSEEFKNESAT